MLLQNMVPLWPRMCSILEDIKITGPNRARAGAPVRKVRLVDRSFLGQSLHGCRYGSRTLRKSGETRKFEEYVDGFCCIKLGSN